MNYQLQDRSYRTPLSLFLLIAAFWLVTGCDSVDPQASKEDPRNGDNEVQIRSDAFTRADLFFQPVSSSPGDPFSIGLMDDDFEGDVTQITHEGTADGRHLLRARFNPLNPASVSVNCRNQNTGSEQTMATLSTDELTAKDTGGQLVAQAMDEPTSFHYIDNGSTVIVEVDYNMPTSQFENPGAMFKFPSFEESVECTHVGFVLRDVSRSLTADGVRFSGGDRRPSFRKKRFMARDR